MTEKELRDLDVEFDSGAMPEDEYLGILRNEVSRLHPEYEQLDVDNMFKMQLRILALEDELAEDSCHRAPSRIKTDDLAAEAHRAELEDKEAEAVEAAAEEAFAQSQAEQQLDENGNEQPLEDQEVPDHHDQPDNGQDDKSQEGNDESKPQEQDNEQQNNSQSKDKDKDKNKSKSKSSKWWWTWQIVPDWNEWMKDETEKHHSDDMSNASTVAHGEVAYSASEFDKDSAITLTQREDGTFSLPESEITHE